MSKLSHNETHVISQQNMIRLVRQWWGVVSAQLLLWGASSFVVFQSQLVKVPLRWMLFSGGTMLLVAVIVRRNLSHNHPSDDETLYPTLGLANLSTIFRGSLVALMSGFLFSRWPTGWMASVPTGLYIVASVLDYTDGFIARATEQQSVMGEKLDTYLDALGILIASLIAIGYGQVAIWFLPVGFSYYLFVTGTWWRKKRGLPVHNLPPSFLRRVMAGTLIGMLCAVISPVLKPPVTTVVAFAFMVPYLIIFTHDWLIVSGRIDPEAKTYKNILRSFASLTGQYLPVMVRLIITVCMILTVRELTLASAWRGLLTLLVLLGVVARVSATFLGIATTILLTHTGMTLLNLIIAVGSSFIMLFGSGRFSLWQPDEVFVRVRYGSRSGPEEIN